MNFRIFGMNFRTAFYLSSIHFRKSGTRTLLRIRLKPACPLRVTLSLLLKYLETVSIEFIETMHPLVARKKVSGRAAVPEARL